MVSSAASQIEASTLRIPPIEESADLVFLKAGGDNLRTTIIKDGKPTDVPDYATVRFNPPPQCCKLVLTTWY